MANITKILQISSLGADAGPFDITAIGGSVSPTTCTRTQLLTGIPITYDQAIITQIRITSTGNCTNSIAITLTPVYDCNLGTLTLT